MRHSGAVMGSGMHKMRMCMGLKITCPHCSNKFDLAEAVRNETLCNLGRAMEKFGKHEGLVWEYSGAFAAKHLGPVAPAKRLRIVTELLRLWESGIFQVQGKRYKIDRAGILKGMLTVCNSEKFGFRNHNYLKRILMADAERVSAEGMTAREERRREEGRGTRDEAAEEETMTLEAQAEFKKKLGVSSFKELIRKGAIKKEEGK